GVGDAARFKPGAKEYRFSCRFSVLEHGPDGALIQRGACTLPGGQELKFVVNDEKGAATADGVFRVFAGLRSDPFILAWLVASLKRFPNLLEHDNVLSIVIELDPRRVFDLGNGSLLGVVAETTPVPGPPTLIGKPPPRFDWVGRPEQTNMRLNNPAMEGTEDLRDLWNQQTPFAIEEELKPLFRQRLIDSLTNWDMRDGKADWTAATLGAAADVYLDDFILIDVSTPTRRAGAVRSIRTSSTSCFPGWSITTESTCKAGLKARPSRASTHFRIWHRPTPSCKRCSKASSYRRLPIRSGPSSGLSAVPGIP